MWELHSQLGKPVEIEEGFSVILIEPNVLIRHGLRYMLESTEGIEVMGECASTEEAYSIVEMPTLIAS